MAAVAENHYTTLGLWLDASDAEIRKAYRRLVLVHHPDRNGGGAESSDRFRAVQEAYDVLGHAARRTWYDASLRPLEPPAATPSSERQLPVPTNEPVDRASTRSLVALSLGAGAEVCLVIAAVQTFGLIAFGATMGWVALRLTAVGAALVGGRIAKRELDDIHRLGTLHTWGLAKVADLPQPSMASRGAARAARLLVRTVPLGFAMLIVMRVLHFVQSGAVRPPGMPPG